MPKASAVRLPERYFAEYEALQKSQFKNRTSLFILTAAGIYYLVCFFYWFRYLLGNPEIFRSAEYYDWAVVAAVSGILYGMNRRTQSPELSKIYGYLFNTFLLMMVGHIGFLYPENALVFPFYFALSLIIVSFTIPWSLPELYFLSILHLAGFSIFYTALARVLQYPVRSLPRFHFFFDGMLFIAIAAALSVLLRKKRIERDIRNFLLLKEIEEKNMQIERDLEFANRIHRTLIPESLRTPRADVTVNYLPVSYLGGDYARFHFCKEDALMFFICDATGHGVAAALMVNRIHTEFERLAKEDITPGVLLQKLDRFICDDFAGTGMYLSAFCGRLDFEQKKFTFSNYGHPPQYFHQVGRSGIEALPAHTTLLGIAKEGRKIHEGEMNFGKGDRIVLFTDGIPEAVSPAGERFGMQRIEKMLKGHFPEARDFNAALLKNLTDFHQGKVFDDILVLSIQVH